MSFTGVSRRVHMRHEGNSFTPVNVCICDMEVCHDLSICDIKVTHSQVCYESFIRDIKAHPCNMLDPSVNVGT